MPSSSLVGAWGEEQAAAYLRRRGYRIEAARYRCRYGEIDLVASRGRFLAFVEVKLRGEGAVGLPRDFVDERKRRRLRTAAELYLAQYGIEAPARFDVAEVYDDETPPRIEYIENAFE